MTDADIGFEAHKNKLIAPRLVYRFKDILLAAKAKHHLVENFLFAGQRRHHLANQSAIAGDIFRGCNNGNVQCCGKLHQPHDPAHQRNAPFDRQLVQEILLHVDDHEAAPGQIKQPERLNHAHPAKTGNSGASMTAPWASFTSRKGGDVFTPSRRANRASSPSSRSENARRCSLAELFAGAPCSVL